MGKGDGFRNKDRVIKKTALKSLSFSVFLNSLFLAIFVIGLAHVICYMCTRNIEYTLKNRVYLPSPNIQQTQFWENCFLNLNSSPFFSTNSPKSKTKIFAFIVSHCQKVICVCVLNKKRNRKSGRKWKKEEKNYR